jgi:hypothetical protein
MILIKLGGLCLRGLGSSFQSLESNWCAVAEERELPKFPDLPWSSIQKGTFIALRSEDVSSRADIEDLILHMFDQAETDFYLYTKVGQPAPSALLHAESRGEIQIPTASRSFYLHRAGGDHSFSEIEEASPDGIEYQQFTLKLTEKKRRELTIEQHLAAADLKRDPDPVLELKPNISGIGVNLRALWRWVSGKR